MNQVLMDESKYRLRKEFIDKLFDTPTRDWQGLNIYTQKWSVAPRLSYICQHLLYECSFFYVLQNEFYVNENFEIVRLLMHNVQTQI